MTRRSNERTASLSFLVITIPCYFAGAAIAQEFVPFVIPAKISAQQSIWVKDYKPIETGSERLTAAEHFRRGGRDVRIWGVNLCFGGNFPTHEEAPYVAERLAAAGVNSVRCHHLDTSRWPRGIWNAENGKTIEPQALDRLDYLINELAKRGIFVNLNLHVGRAHSQYLGLPATGTEFDKIAGIFTPALVEAQKQYAKDLLTHANPYCGGVRYADDPAIAFVEITNEDSFFMWGAEEKLRTFPEYYSKILNGQFNAWLRRRYNTDDALRAAWSQGTQPPGDNMLQNSTFTAWDAKRGIPEHWSIEQHEGCRATLSRSQDLPSGAIQVEIGKANSTEWHLQLTQGGCALTEGQYYTVSFQASSVQPRSITCNVSQAHESWANLGLSRRIDLSPQWKKFSLGFTATGSDKNARITFAFSASPTTFSLAQVEVRPGGQMGLTPGESAGAGNVRLFQENESTPRILDRMIFLAETEKAYFDGMRSYIREDLGCGALVTGTIVFGPLGLYAQSDMDYIDSHSYWQHPTFPGRPWDPANWLVEQRPMTDHPDQATLSRIAAERLAGKPFTLSEYNHPAPLDAQAECIPMVASFAAAQDWDGVWLFDYASGSNAWDRQTMSGFFDIDTNPAKWGFVRAGAAIFNGGPKAGQTQPAMRDVGAKNLSPLPAIAKQQAKYGDNMLRLLTATSNIRRDDLLQTQIGFPNATSRIWGPFLGWQMDDLGLTAQTSPVQSQYRLTWWVDAAGHGIYRAVGQAQVYTGHAKRFAEITGDRIRITSPDFVALTITPLGPVGANNHSPLLITACGRCENTGMQFSPDRRTVGRNWGQAPVRIEAVRGSLAVPEGRWTCYALAPNGSRKQCVPISYVDRRDAVPLSPEYGTMWYLLEPQP
ncbi:MAG: carbohydrate binding domain-containing protein [Planctomycetes bacterium]|nr:carbohydrate binding domain-containing protein [Planctomycetota bacterium]